MLKRTSGKLQEAIVGKCVAIFVTEFDRGRWDSPNIVGVILEIKDKKYKIGTKAGIVSNWLERNAFECVLYKGLKTSTHGSLNLREIVKKLSVGNGHVYVRCQCKGACVAEKCKCFKWNILCNSACHGRSPCENCDK